MQGQEAVSPNAFRRLAAVLDDTGNVDEGPVAPSVSVVIDEVEE